MIKHSGRILMSIIAGQKLSVLQIWIKFSSRTREKKPNQLDSTSTPNMQSFNHINRKTKGQSSFLICTNQYPKARGQKGHCSLRNGLTSKGNYQDTWWLSSAWDSATISPSILPLHVICRKKLSALSNIVLSNSRYCAWVSEVIYAESFNSGICKSN